MPFVFAPFCDSANYKMTHGENQSPIYRLSIIKTFSKSILFRDSANDAFAQ
jgi:hypothetical protein